MAKRLNVLYFPWENKYVLCEKLIHDKSPHKETSFKTLSELLDHLTKEYRRNLEIALDKTLPETDKKLVERTVKEKLKKAIIMEY
ncbi:MAG: hypothetical protein N3G19_02675 [Candidatus Pacearchaeota archaeon]|nr:hypothetical protein [Candidatus Pacearchaeota archaeon]